MTKRVAMFVLNNVENDSRVKRSANTLSENGFDVHLFGITNGQEKVITKIEDTEVTLLPVVTLQRRIYLIKRGFKLFVIHYIRNPIRTCLRKSFKFIRRLILIAFRLSYRATKLLWETYTKRDEIALLDTLPIFKHRLFLGYDNPAYSIKRPSKENTTTNASTAGDSTQKAEVLPQRAKKSRTSKIIPISLLQAANKYYLQNSFRYAARKEIRKFKPDLIHCHDLNTLAIGADDKKNSAIKVIYDSHELWLKRNSTVHPLAEKWERTLERKYINSCDAVITVSPSIATWLKRTYKLQKDVYVLRNTPDLIENTDPENKLESDLRTHLKERIQTQFKEPVIISYTGRFCPGRGLEELVKSSASLSDNIYITLTGYGADDYVAHLNKLISQHSRENVFIFAPVESKNVSRYISRADLAYCYIEPICLSYRFSLPNKLFEAIQGGLPVLVNDLPDIKNLVTKYDIGVIFNDNNDIAHSLNAIVNNENALRSMKNNVQKAILPNSWQSEQNVLLEVYSSLS